LNWISNSKRQHCEGVTILRYVFEYCFFQFKLTTRGIKGTCTMKKVGKIHDVSERVKKEREKTERDRERWRETEWDRHTDRNKYETT